MLQHVHHDLGLEDGCRQSQIGATGDAIVKLFQIKARRLLALVHVLLQLLGKLSRQIAPFIARDALAQRFQRGFNHLQGDVTGGNSGLFLHLPYEFICLHAFHLSCV